MRAISPRRAIILILLCVAYLCIQGCLAANHFSPTTEADMRNQASSGPQEQFWVDLSAREFVQAANTWAERCQFEYGTMRYADRQVAAILEDMHMTGDYRASGFLDGRYGPPPIPQFTGVHQIIDVHQQDEHTAEVRILGFYYSDGILQAIQSECFSEV